MTISVPFDDVDDLLRFSHYMPSMYAVYAACSLVTRYAILFLNLTVLQSFVITIDRRTIRGVNK